MVQPCFGVVGTQNAPNILFVKFEDMKTNPLEFINIENVTDGLLLHGTSFCLNEEVVEGSCIGERLGAGTSSSQTKREVFDKVFAHRMSMTGPTFQFD